MSKETTHRAEELKELGWTNDDLLRYTELWDYRQRWGAINLERDDRLFLRKAEAALPKIQTNKASIKKPIHEKSYYRWLMFYLEAMNKAEASLAIPSGERGIWPIFIEEELRALDYYQPVLGLPDTLKAKRIDAFREDINKSFTNQADQTYTIMTFDFKAPLEDLKAKETSKWRHLRDDTLISDEAYPVLKENAVAGFRSKVRSELIDLIVKTLPSLADTDKPVPPDDWSRD